MLVHGHLGNIPLATSLFIPSGVSAYASRGPLLRPLHQPGDKLFVHRFPRDLPPGEVVSVELGGVDKILFDTTGLVVQAPRRQPNQKRMKRFTHVELEFGQKVIAHELQMNLTTSEIFVIGQIHSALILEPQVLIPRRSTLTTYYLRKDKRKVLHAYFQSGGHPVISIDLVFEGYDRVYCVDTNTAIDPGGRSVAVTTALAVTSQRLGDRALHVTSDNTIQVVAYNPPSGNPELHGIWSVLGILVRNHPELVEGRLAIITDTEFGMVKAWHERTEPFYDGHWLPDDVDIFYATADAGSDEFMVNRLMKRCDSLSTKKLRELTVT